MNDFYNVDSFEKAVTTAVRHLLLKSGQNKFPISLSSVAKAIGINPRPIYYKNLDLDGCVIIRENSELRIGIKTSSGKEPHFSIDNLNKIRFVYAHELAHCLFYDVKTRPSKRLAPLPKGFEEEKFCNYFAEILTTPPWLLKNYYWNLEGSFEERLLKLADLTKTNISPLVKRLLKYNILKDKNNKIFILSAIVSLSSNAKAEPRIITSKIYFDNNEEDIFIAPNRRIIHVENANKEHWSLVEFYEQLAIGSRFYKTIYGEEIIVNGKCYKLSGVHKRIPNTKYVWSDIDIIETKDCYHINK